MNPTLKDIVFLPAMVLGVVLCMVAMVFGGEWTYKKVKDALFSEM